jgi:hypothetical protein
MKIDRKTLQHLIATETDPERKAALERDYVARFGEPA